MLTSLLIILLKLENTMFLRSETESQPSCVSRRRVIEYLITSKPQEH